MNSNELLGNKLIREIAHPSTGELLLSKVTRYLRGGVSYEDAKAAKAAEDVFASWVTEMYPVVLGVNLGLAKLIEKAKTSVPGVVAMLGEQLEVEKAQTRLWRDAINELGYDATLIARTFYQRLSAIGHEPVDPAMNAYRFIARDSSDLEVRFDQHFAGQFMIRSLIQYVASQIYDGVATSFTVQKSPSLVEWFAAHTEPIAPEPLNYFNSLRVEEASQAQITEYARRAAFLFVECTAIHDRVRRPRPTKNKPF